jgi:hypothetical protein
MQVQVGAIMGRVQVGALIMELTALMVAVPNQILVGAKVGRHLSRMSHHEQLDHQQVLAAIVHAVVHSVNKRQQLKPIFYGNYR